jgi:cell division protein FtsZ
MAGSEMSGMSRNGGRMQFKSSDDAYKRELAPQEWTGMAHAKPEVHVAQEDQWAVLRHEVEGEGMRRQDERVERRERGRPGWEQHDTEDDAIAPQIAFNALAQVQHHVDIVVAGVGGGGMNAVNRMISTHVRGVRFVAMNTDGQVLSLSEAPQRICLGQHHTRGLGAGGNAAVGTRAATESAAEIRAALGEADLVFIAAGMGGGTGTGSAPVVASIAKKLGALTVGIVTLPFSFEGTRRRRIAEEGLANLGAEVDALITIPNDRLLSVTGRDRTLTDAFKIADDVLRQGVQGIAEVINVPGMVNVDFADVRSVLREAGSALMSIGQGQGHNRAQHAAEEAIAGGFLNVSIRGAQRVLFNISGDEDMTLFEVNEVAEYIGKAIDSAADITFGAVIDPALKDTIRVTLIAAGMEERRTMRIPAMNVDQLRATQKSVPAPQSPVAPAAPGRPAGVNEHPAASPVRPAPMQPQRPSLNAPGRPQRSLDDLRGLRSMGRRQETSRGGRLQADEEGEGEANDGPPFFKRFP